MIYFYSFLLLTINSLSVFAEEDYPDFFGAYENPRYIDEDTFSVPSLKTYKNESNEIILEFNIPCGSKVTPAIYRVDDFEHGFGKLSLLRPGSGQCYQGESMSLRFSKETIRLYTYPSIRTLGFDGTYQMYKKAEVNEK